MKDGDKRFRIIRHFQTGYDRKVPVVEQWGLTFAEASAWIANPEHSSRTGKLPEAINLTKNNGPWFDAYEEIS